MAKLNTAAQRQPSKASRSPIKTLSVPTARTGNGAPAYQFEEKAELYLLASGRFFGEASFYESADAGKQRLIELAKKVSVADPKWFADMVRWLRGPGNIRTASVVLGHEGGEAWRKDGVTGVRQLVRSVLQRADEPRDFVAWRLSQGHRSHPGGMQRGVADAVTDMFTERNAIKWNGGQGAVTMADVIELVHPKPKAQWQSDLFNYLLTERHHPGNGVITERMPMLRAYKELQQRLHTERDKVIAEAIADPEMLSRAGMTWEALSSSGPMDDKAWSAIIPLMGYEALLKNLRNFDQRGVGQAVKKAVAKRLSDPDEVARSRQLPYRFLSAYLEAQGAVWQPALEEALSYSVRNIPVMNGKTVVLVDTSSSMRYLVSEKSKMSYVMAGTLAGVALAAAQGNAYLGGFANAIKPFWHPVTQGAAVLRTAEAFARRIGEDGHGTEITAAVQWAYRSHPDVRRIVVFTDGQCSTGGVGKSVPASVTIYGVNLAGYGQTALGSGSNRHQLGGFGDSSFALMNAIEQAAAGKWPWEVEQQYASAA